MSTTPVIAPEPLVAALSIEVQLGLTVVYIILYGFLFVIVLIQLWMIYRFKHRLLSYQTAFLFLSLLWAALRIELFSFYFKNSELANELPFIFYWLLYCCPICIQFITLTLLVAFFAQVIFRTIADYNIIRFRLLLFGSISLAVVIFLITNITCAKFVHDYTSTSRQVPHYIPIVRVAINDTLFLLAGAVLSICLYRVSQISSISVMLEAKGTTKRQAIAATLVIVFLYTSRAIYNMIAVIDGHLLSFGYGWINVTDQADNVILHRSIAYASFGIVLFVWEFLPTLAVVLFYRVRVPKRSEHAGIAPETSPVRCEFFANPRRYDSDDELDRELSIQSRSSSLHGSSPATGHSVHDRFLSNSPRTGTAGYYGTFPHGVSPLTRGSAFRSSPQRHESISPLAHGSLSPLVRNPHATADTANSSQQQKQRQSQLLQSPGTVYDGT